MIVTLKSIVNYYMLIKKRLPGTVLTKAGMKQILCDWRVNICTYILSSALKPENCLRYLPYLPRQGSLSANRICLYVFRPLRSRTLRVIKYIQTECNKRLKANYVCVFYSILHSVINLISKIKCDYVFLDSDILEYLSLWTNIMYCCRHINKFRCCKLIMKICYEKMLYLSF